MSVADHYENSRDFAYVRGYDPVMARRQFQSSLALVVILAAAAFLLGLLVSVDLGVAQSGRAVAPVKIERTNFGHLGVAQNDRGAKQAIILALN